MKRVTRYWQGPEFRTAVDREKARARVESEQKERVTYAIHDPTTPDYVGEFNTLIVYVGQSKDFGSRVDRRLREAGTATRRPTSHVEGLMYDIMRRGGVPAVSGDRACRQRHRLSSQKPTGRSDHRAGLSARFFTADSGSRTALPKTFWNVDQPPSAI